jgi:hypothetical protein
LLKNWKLKDRGFFTTNWNLANRCMGVLKSLLPIQEVDI